MGLKDLELKSLLSKLVATEDEITMVDAINDEYLSEFLGQVDSIANKLNLKRNELPIVDQTTELSSEKEIFKSTNMPEDIKKVYRKIVIMTHPDKNLDKPEKEKEVLSEIFDRAAKAFDETDIIELLKICKELNIEGFELGHDHLNVIKERIKQLDGKLDSIKKSSLYTWYTLDGDAKDSFVENLIKSSYVSK